MSVCGLCKGKVERNVNNKIECAQCKTLFHANCVKLNPSDIEFLNKDNTPWKCSNCENYNRKLRLNNSPPLSPVNVICNSQKKINDSSKCSDVNIKKMSDDNFSLTILKKTKKY